jgi:hypothetical protein
VSRRTLAFLIVAVTVLVFAYAAFGYWLANWATSPILDSPVSTTPPVPTHHHLER